MLRVAYADLDRALHRAMLHLGLRGDRAALCARLFAETTRDGVYTHGLDRFPRFAAMVANGSIDVAAEPTCVAAAAALERWDGHLGPGNLNACAAIERAIELARKHGLGAVALANTNHWMRGGSYGWLAAESGLFAICWTNTLANLPAWGAASPTLGNNPLVVAIPRPDGAHVVLDMAVSQFSYGTIAAYAARGEQLPVPGGYDAAGNLSTDPADIEASQRALPIGYWKGSGLSLVLDLLAAMLSGGLATHQIPRRSGARVRPQPNFFCHRSLQLRRPPRARPHRQRHSRLAPRGRPHRSRPPRALPRPADAPPARREPPLRRSRRSCVMGEAARALVLGVV